MNNNPDFKFHFVFENNDFYFNSVDEIRKRIVILFKDRVRGKSPEVSNQNIKHAGKVGHWLELAMGIKHNADNAPDLFGFEMKNFTRSKTTFGDWSADYYIFKDKNFSINRDNFLQIFGKPNLKKNNRFSWSGEPCPKIGHYNSFGQILRVDNYNNISIFYNYSNDLRVNKNKIIPFELRTSEVLLAKWEKNSIKLKLESKFNKLGWFKCVQDNNGIYTQIIFGNPITFSNWISSVKKGLVFLDSGMYQGNLRNYSQWRAENKYWENLVVYRFTGDES